MTLTVGCQASAAQGAITLTDTYCEQRWLFSSEKTVTFRPKHPLVLESGKMTEIKYHYTYYVGQIAHYTAWTALTGNYYHGQGNSDLTYIGDSRDYSANSNIEVEPYRKIDAQLPDGYYTYAVRCQIEDEKTELVIEYYGLEQELLFTQNTGFTATRLANRNNNDPFSYRWIAISQFETLNND